MKNYVRTTYLEFLYPGDYGSIRKVRTRDISKVKVPKNAFGFCFFDILSVMADADGKKVLLESSQINESPMYYYGGKVYTIVELKRKFPNEDILINNLKTNGCKKAILSRVGNWQLFQKTDVFIKVA